MGSTKAQGKLLSADVKNLKSDTKKKKKSKAGIVVPDALTAKLIERMYEDAGTAIKNSLSASAKSSNNNPLGVLTTAQIQQGRTILQSIQDELQNEPKMIGSEDSFLVDQTNKFYSAIPQRLPLQNDKPRDRSRLKHCCKNRREGRYVEATGRR